MKLKRQSLIAGGSLASALLSFLPLACCVFPTTLAFLGTGSLVFAASMMPYRPYFVTLTFVFLGLGFYFAYRPQRQCNEESACAKPASRKATRVILWIVTGFTLMLVLFPSFVPYLPI